MRKITFFITILSFLFINHFSFSQNSDVDSQTKFNVSSEFGITAEERAVLNSNSQNVSTVVPEELLNEINEARLSGDIEQVKSLTDYMYQTYRPEVKLIGSEQSNTFDLPVKEELSLITPEDHDWLDGDVMVTADTGGLSQFRRTLDVKRGDDGALYLANIYNTATQRRIRVSKSTNGGQNWTVVGGIFYPSLNNHFQTLSMLVESKAASVDDSIRVIVYYTYSADNSNDNAKLGYFQFKPNDNSFGYIIKTLASPSAGREFNYVSAVSDGQYWQSGTYFGCVIGEYSNNDDTTVAHHVFQTVDWGNTHNSVQINTSFRDILPNAAFLEGNGADSVVFVTQRIFSTPGDEVRVQFTSWSTLTAATRTVFLTVDTVQYEKPVIAIKQGIANTDKKIVISCTKEGRARYHGSANSGLTWTLDYVLDNRPNFSSNTNYTYVSSDSTGTAGDFCAMFSYRGTGDDSINVRRGTLGSGMGTTNYKMNSNEITSTHPAVTAIYRDGGNLYSTFAYWRNGPYGVYFDNENLVTGIDDDNKSIESYSLQQNYPNPFNPSTSIRFSIPEQTNVSLKIFNSIGQEVASLVNGVLTAGNHEVNFNASKLSSGVYFYRIDTPAFTSTKKMILIK